MVAKQLRVCIEQEEQEYIAYVDNIGYNEWGQILGIGETPTKALAELKTSLLELIQQIEETEQ